MTERMLIVEEPGVASVAMRRYFEASGYEVDVARDRVDAEDLIRLNRYDVIIVDIRLAGLAHHRGLELAEKVRGKDPRTRIVALSGYGTRKIERAAEQLGVDAVLLKPVSLELVARAARGEP